MTRRITIEYYAILREQRGLKREETDTNAETIAELYEDLSHRHGFSLDRDRLKAVVNEEFVSWDHQLRDGDTIVFIPPVAGG